MSIRYWSNNTALCPCMAYVPVGSHLSVMMDPFLAASFFACGGAGGVTQPFMAVVSVKRQTTQKRTPDSGGQTLLLAL